ncbi:hypothetical protein G5I_04862 [Acromyrmex echinatior]|uniref:Uncharacterized protein n=1 Tax=Acromyrmex echinatior TaxID=103372 RepID=F4WGR5_ACREC|nr:hypothetical protein G5I_04862 [Acromyrmex echinatior]
MRLVHVEAAARVSAWYAKTSGDGSSSNTDGGRPGLYQSGLKSSHYWLILCALSIVEHKTILIQPRLVQNYSGQKHYMISENTLQFFQKKRQWQDMILHIYVYKASSHLEYFISR